MNIIPVGKRLVLKAVNKEAKTSSGIIIAEKEQDQAIYAEVVAISNEIEDKDLIKVGDKLIYNKYKSTSVKDDQVEYIIVDLEDVLAIVR